MAGIARERSFWWEFNQPIVRVVWPASLQHLPLGHDFDQSIDRVGWPASLQLLFGDYFNAKVAWPISLHQLSFGCDVNQIITGVVWPATLQQSSFGDAFNQPIVGVRWPSSLVQISFGKDFDQSVAGVIPFRDVTTLRVFFWSPPNRHASCFQLDSSSWQSPTRPTHNNLSQKFQP